VIVDRTGRKIKIGSFVDINCVGMFHGKVIAIKDQSIQLSPKQQINPHVVIDVIFTPFILPNGCVPDVYIIGDPDPKDPLVVESDNKSEGRIVKPS
jgi:hypothetical protein